MSQARKPQTTHLGTLVFVFSSFVSPLAVGFSLKTVDLSYSRPKAVCKPTSLGALHTDLLVFQPSSVASIDAERRPRFLKTFVCVKRGAGGFPFLLPSSLPALFFVLSLPPSRPFPRSFSRESEWRVFTWCY